MARGTVKKRRKQRWLILLGGVLLVLLAGWALLEFGLRIDRYRPQVEARLEEATGLPAELGELDLSVLRGVVITGYDLKLGEGDFALAAPRVRLWPRVRPMVRGEIHIAAIEIEEPALRVPDDPATAKERIAAVITQLQQQPGREPQTIIGEIRIQNAAIYQGTAPDYALQSDITIDNALTEEVDLWLNGTAPYMGRDARIQARFVLHLPQGEARGLEGALAFQNVDLAVLAAATTLTGTTVNGTMDIATENLQRFDIVSNGTIDIPSFPALGGSYGVGGAWEDGIFTFENGAWVAPGLQAVLSGRWEGSEGLELTVQEATLQERGLQALLARADAKMGVSAPGGVAVVANNIRLAAVKGQIVVQQARLTLPGIQILADGDPFLQAVWGQVNVRDNVFHLAPLRSENLELRGAIAPDWNTGVATFNLHGQGMLDDAVLAMWLDTQALQQLSANVEIQQLKGTYRQGEGVPDDLVVQARITEGRATVRRPEFSEALRNIEGSVEGAPGAVEAQLAGESESLGSIEVKAQYAVPERALRGALTLPLQNGHALLVEKLELPEVAAAIAASYGQSTIGFAIHLPQDDEPLVIALEREGDPELQVDLTLARDAEGYTLAAVDAKGRFPAEALDSVVPDRLDLRGPVNVGVSQERGTGRFSVDADLTTTEITLGDLLKKDPEHTAGLIIAGTVERNRWEPQTAEIRLLEERFHARIENKAVVIDDLDVQVAALAPLARLPAGAEHLRNATGRITGQIDTSGPVELRFHEVAFPLTGAFAIDRLDGTVRYEDGALAARDVRLLGLNSDLELAARQRGALWEAQLTGRTLDINAILAVWRELRPQPEEDQPDQTVMQAVLPGDQEPWVQGEIEVALDQVLFEDAALAQVRTRIVLKDRDVSFQDLRLVPGEGEVTGRLDIKQVVGKGPTVYDIEIELDRVDAGVIEDLREGDEQRDIEGTVSGDIDLTLTEQEGESIFAGADGTVNLTARDGTFGKMGFATKVLGLMQATGILSLRAPFQRHGGLFYRTVDTELEFDDGVMEIEEAELRAASYTMRARGTVDFDQLESDVRVNVDLLEGATGLIEKVPVVGDIIGLAKRPFDVRLRLTGSPYDPTVQQNLGQGSSRVARTEDAPQRRTARDVPDEQPRPEHEDHPLLRALTGEGPEDENQTEEEEG
jgi:hypothetical protein